MDKEYNGMYLSTLEDSFSDGYTKLVNANKKNIPHISMLEDSDVRRSIIQNKKIWYFKDKIGNTYCYCFYAGVRPDLTDNSVVKLAMDSETVLKWKNAICARDRNTGGGWIENTANDFTRWEIGSTELGKKLGLNPKMKWSEAIKFIEENNIKHNEPILLVVKDRTVVSFNTAWKQSLSGVLQVLVVIAGAIAIALSAGTLAIGIIAASKALFSVIDKMVAGGNVSFNELTGLAVNTAPLFADSPDLSEINKKVDWLKNDTTINMVKKGYELYNSKLKNNLNDVLGVAGLSGLADYQEGIDIANDILKNLETSDVKNLANNLGITDAEAEKVKLAYEFLDKSKNLIKLPANSQNADGSLAIPEIQNFIINTYSSLLEREGSNLKTVTAVIPNSVGAIKLINDGYKLAPEESKNLLNLLQGEYSNAIYLKKLAINAIINEAKSFENTNTVYYLPSNVPPRTQLEAGKIIQKTLKVDIESTNDSVNLALKFDREFI